MHAPQSHRPSCFLHNVESSPISMRAAYLGSMDLSYDAEHNSISSSKRPLLLSIPSPLPENFHGASRHQETKLKSVESKVLIWSVDRV